jgi:diguanylate cyclase (GGDEF)-like protein
MNTQPLKILVIEDHPGDLRLIWEQLQEAGMFPFVMVHESELAASRCRLQREMPDLVLLDLNLPDSTGLDTLKRLEDLIADLPVIVLTALTDSQMGVEAVKNGAQDYLVKGQTDAQLLGRAVLYSLERHRLLTALRSLALIDALTGLYNRRGFTALAEQQLRLARRNERDLLVIMMDLDGMKQINDIFGHQEGDLALQATAHLLGQVFRRTDIKGRLGGDEFAVLGLETDLGTVDQILMRFNKNLGELNAAWERPYRLSLSLGLAQFDPNEPGSLEELLDRADQALYQNKRLKGTVDIFNQP